jgi:ketosteroid isomerase-like protein
MVTVALIPRTGNEFIMNNTPDTRDIVNRALRAFSKAMQGGDWEAYFDHFSNDIVYWCPVPGPFNGKNEGKDRFRAFYKEMAPQLDFVIEAPHTLIVDGAIASAEYMESGKMNGEPASNRVCMSYRVEDGVIIEAREYIGDLTNGQE